MARRLLSLCLLGMLPAALPASPLDYFLAPVENEYAAAADLEPFNQVPDVDTCANRCLSNPDCISFNLCAGDNSSYFNCGISGWNISYVPAASDACSWWRRITPRDDTPLGGQAVPWLLAVPVSGVSVSSGPLADGFWGNVNTYLKVRDPLDMLFFFAQRAGIQNPEGYCFGWDSWIKGSATGNYLMVRAFAHVPGLAWTAPRCGFLTVPRCHRNRSRARVSARNRIRWLTALSALVHYSYHTLSSNSPLSWRGAGCRRCPPLDRRRPAAHQCTAGGRWHLDVR